MGEYAEMQKRFVLDCSVSAAWCFSDEKNDYVDKVLESFTHGYKAWIPHIWYIEMINVLTTAERQSRITRAGSEHFLTLFSSLPISSPIFPEQKLDKNLLALSGSFHLSAYDACYLKLALEYAIPLATQDSGLRKACRSAGIPILN